MITSREINFSLVLPTKNGSERLEETIRFIGKLEVPSNYNFEVIVVDSKSTDNTIELAEAYCEKLLKDKKYSVLSQFEEGKSKAIELGIVSAKYNWIILCDDDNLLFADYLVQALQVIKSDDQIGIIGGSSILYGDFSNAPAWFENYKARYAIGTQGGYGLEQEGPLGNIWGAGMVFKKEIFLHLADLKYEMLTGKKTFSHYIAGEDYEFCILANLLGYKTYYSSKLKFYHALHPARITWNGFKQMLIRNCLPMIYISMYEYVSKKQNTKAPLNGQHFLDELEKDVKAKKSTLRYKKLLGKVLNKREGYFFDADWEVKKAEMEEINRLRLVIDGYLNKIEKLYATVQRKAYLQEL